jgi:hypothetical protein
MARVVPKGIGADYERGNSAFFTCFPGQKIRMQFEIRRSSRYPLNSFELTQPPFLVQLTK